MKDQKKEYIKDFLRIEEEIESKKKLPNEEKQKIKKIKIKNILSLVLVTLYLVSALITSENMPTDIFIRVYRIATLIICLFTIIFIEYAYKKNSNLLIIISIEMIILTLYSIFAISAYSLYYGQFYKIIICAEVTIIIYYAIKSIVSIHKIKKNYFNNLSDIKTIVAK